MNPRYVDTWVELRAAEGLDKYAQLETHPEALAAAQVKLAELCDGLFSDLVKQAGAGGTTDESTIRLLDHVLALRDTHAAVGEKVSEDQSEVVVFATKLAAAYFVDQVLTREMEKRSGEDRRAVMRTRALGREYATTLIRGLMR